MLCVVVSQFTSMNLPIQKPQSRSRFHCYSQVVSNQVVSLDVFEVIHVVLICLVLVLMMECISNLQFLEVKQLVAVLIDIVQLSRQEKIRMAICLFSNLEMHC